MKQENKNKGFTLVEMIVVIVIIGILLAILVPGLFKYIKKAKDQQALIECRAVVTAAQTMAIELYGKNEFVKDTFLTTHKNEIIEAADASGSIESILFNNPLEAPSVTYMKYITSGKIVVIFDVSDANVYYIEDSSSHSMDDKVKKAQDIYDSSTGTNKWNSAKEKFYDSDTAKLEEKELDILKNGGLSNPEQYRWKPCKYIDSTTGKEVVFLSACSSALNQQNTPLIYLNGSYYYYRHVNKYTNTTIGTTSIPDATATKAVQEILNNYYTEDTLTDTTNNVWVKVTN